ncbi:thioesterase II family protein [Streptomyces sp. NPDC006530]|uniref:thioesterase II family protein n=1 Tax=Streptomyces sp. NPDC006530 TaxID=3364750 RepID=UPI0036CF3F00
MSQTPEAAGARANRALQSWTPRPQATTVVYAIAHAGSGAAAWNPVASALPEDLELRAIRLPGRENRIGSAPHTSVAAAADEVARVIAADTAGHGKPVLLIGSCFGAMVSLAAMGVIPSGVPVRALLSVRQPVPAHVTPASGASPGSMSAAELRTWLREYQLTPAALLDDDAVYEFFEPLLRADLSMTDGYAFAGSPLEVPVFLLRTAAPEESLDPGAWEHVTSARVRVHDVAADGDPLTEAPTALAEAIAEIATLVLPAATPAPRQT